MAKKWVYQYGNHTIKVVNKSINGSELYVDDVLRDQFTKASLNDHLTADMESGERITVTLEGVLATECYLMVNGRPQRPVSVE